MRTAILFAAAMAGTATAFAPSGLGFAPATAQRSAFTPAAVPPTLRAARSIRPPAKVAAPLRMQTATGVDTSALTRAANEARGLAMDSIAAAKSGHLGLPLGCAEIGAVLYGDFMQYNPKDPQWLNRDRFVLSGGHGSMFLYSWLHMAGYELPMSEVKNFRQHHSMTPGHPEFPNSEHNTPGIEATTGPLGQGVVNAAGIAAAQKMEQAMFNTKDHTIFDSVTISLCGDGCLQEGVSAEGAAFAAHEGLDNLIIVYDSNDVTLDKMAEYTQSEDTAARYEAYGWEVVTIDGHDIEAVKKTLDGFRAAKNGKPKLLIAKTIIGKGIDEVAGTNAAHGEAGVAFVAESKKRLGLTEPWQVSKDTYDHFGSVEKKLVEKYDAWKKTYGDWKGANGDKAALLEKFQKKEVMSAADMFKAIPEFDQDKDIATREAGARVINDISDLVPQFLSGSADLHGSNKNYIKNGGNYGRGFDKSYTGKNFYFGIREHAMGSLMNGIAFHGLFRPSGATFLVFVDYMRATLRVAALAELPTTYILTHDSIGVGEDGPTHQPVETVTSLRTFPNMHVMRPADPEETVGAYVHSQQRQDGPTSLILTRQNVRTLKEVPVATRREGTLKGGYVAHKEKGDLKMIIMAAGSEVQHAMDAAKAIGDGVRVVSMPCMDVFDMQPQSYKDEVLPKSCTKRVAMEAGVGVYWYKYTGLDGKVVSVERFGFSAPGDIVMKELGMTADNLIKECKAYM
jgi:transketolase